MHLYGDKHFHQCFAGQRLIPLKDDLSKSQLRGTAIDFFKNRMIKYRENAHQPFPNTTFLESCCVFLIHCTFHPH